MSDAEFLIAFSIMPIGGLLLAGFVYWINMREIRKHR
jgi:hypothetical protein